VDYDLKENEVVKVREFNGDDREQWMQCVIGNMEEVRPTSSRIL